MEVVVWGCILDWIVPEGTPQSLDLVVSFFFFSSFMYSLFLSNSDIRCSVCIESFTFAHIHISLDLQILIEIITEC